ncbi:collectin-12-like [Gigantopelta aegis]|uniref:collectin-12-like n=1 Tax=Gigantopelta aegis TaxID=1735272 RepID=UPI001B88E268|nr:collectin-12-like [Gigantopelta aegis]
MAENEFVKTMIPNQVHNYIGATKLADPTTPTWQWLDPSANPIPPAPGAPGPGFEDWRAGQPGGPAAQYCMTINFNNGIYKWNDLRCSRSQNYICEKNAKWPKNMSTEQC